MAVPQQKFREVVLQILYALDQHVVDKEALISVLMKENAIPKKAACEAFAFAERVREHLSVIDEKLAPLSENFDWKRFQSVEKNILRLGAYDILYNDQIDDPLVLSESVRLAKKFSTPEAGRLVNALLHALYMQKS